MGQKPSSKKTDKSACIHQIRLPQELDQLPQELQQQLEDQCGTEPLFEIKIAYLEWYYSLLKKMSEMMDLSTHDYLQAKDDILHERFGCKPYFLREDEFHLDRNPELEMLGLSFNGAFAKRASIDQTKKDLERRPKETFIGESYLKWVKEYLRTDDEELWYQLLGLVVETCSGAMHASLMFYWAQNHPEQSPLKLNEICLKNYTRSDNHGELFFHQASGPGKDDIDGYVKPPTFLIKFSIIWWIDDGNEMHHVFCYKQCKRVD
tara:strand:+ start:976 stop:1764 length:789 start_codon:yes stop_codon:yes gene_type:complete